MESSKFRAVIIENLTKNLVVIIFLFMSYQGLKNGISGIPLDSVSNFLSLISILVMTVCFANFAFTYGQVKMHYKFPRFLAHGATFLFMLLIALLLESLVITIGIAYPSIYHMTMIFSVLLYLSLIFYDFLDLFKVS